MAISVDYLARQTSSNLVRNPSLSIATILTVSVSLSLLGASLMIQQGVANVSDLFRADVELLVWVNEDATEEQITDIRVFLEGAPSVESVDYIEREQIVEEFRQYWEGNPEILETTDPESLPTRYEVSPVRQDVASMEALSADVAQQPGVDDVQFPEDFVRNLNRAVSSISRTIIIGAGISGLASTMIMYNTIRTGLFARRKEIEVMRLVGATKWFIRIPYMLEGLVQGVIGAVIAMLALLGLNQVISNTVSDSENRVLRSFSLDFIDVFGISGVLFVIGALLGAVAAGIAVTRYLDA